MKEKTCKSVRFYYGLIFSLYTAVVAALFICQVLDLYYTGTAAGHVGNVFTRERVEGALSKILLFFWLWVGFAIAGLIVWEVFPVKQKPRKISPDLQYARLVKRMPLFAPEGKEEAFRQVAEKRKLVFALKCAAWAQFAIAVIFGIVYLAIPSNFTAHASEKIATGEVLDMAKYVFPCIFAGLLILCGAAAYQKYAVKSILPSVQKLTAGQKVQPRTDIIARAEYILSNKWVVLGIRVALGIISLTLISVGALNGNMADILNKATNICSQCIGLG